MYRQRNPFPVAELVLLEALTVLLVIVVTMRANFYFYIAPSVPGSLIIVVLLTACDYLEQL